jgi:two-component system, NarL family, response regulator DevR
MELALKNLDELLEQRGLPLRVMVVDDHQVVRDGLRALLEASGEIVIAEAESCDEAVNEALRCKPQVIVMDVRLGPESGIDATRRIKEIMPQAQVIMLTSFPDEDALAASLLAGASGFVLKEVSGNDIVEAVRKVARGGSAFDTRLLEAGALDRLGGLLANVPFEQGPEPENQGPSPLPPDLGAGHDESNKQGG